MSGPRYRSTATQKIWQCQESNPGPLGLQPGSVASRPERRSIQFTPPDNICTRFILILSTHLHLDLPSALFPSGFPTNNIIDVHLPHSYHMPRPPHPPRIDNCNYIWRRVQYSSCKIWGFQGAMKNVVLWDINTQFVLHRRHIMSPLKGPAS
jgi:hypothetical protein